MKEGPLPRLCLLPGLLNDADLWRDQVVALSDVADCIVPDLTRAETLEGLARGVLDSCGPSFALAGFSLGGYVALEIARQAPQRITGLALLDTSIVADTPQRLAERHQLEAAAAMPGRFHGFGSALLGRYVAPAHRNDEAILGRIRGMTERLGAEVFIRQSRIERRDGTATLRRLSCPILIVCGDSDALTPLEGHRAMLQHAPHAKLAVIPNSGHMTPIENPDAVTAAIREWLARLP